MGPRLALEICMLKLSSILGGGLVAATLFFAQQASAQPGGSYAESCRRIEQRGPILHALCEDVNGRFRPTSIDLGQCGGPIANTNGQLTCGGGRPRTSDRDREREPRGPDFGRPPY